MSTMCECIRFGVACERINRELSSLIRSIERRKTKTHAEFEANARTLHILRGVRQLLVEGKMHGEIKEQASLLLLLFSRLDIGWGRNRFHVAVSSLREFK